MSPLTIPMVNMDKIGKAETAWTPGPWLAAAKPSSVVGWPVVSPAAQGRSICSVTYVHASAIDPSVPGDRAFNEESRANTRLIAAAPELYEALKEMVAECSPYSADTAERENAISRAFAAARSAITKAEAKS